MMKDDVVGSAGESRRAYLSRAGIVHMEWKGLGQGIIQY